MAATLADLLNRYEELKRMHAETRAWTTPDRDMTLDAIDTELAYLAEDIMELGGGFPEGEG